MQAARAALLVCLFSIVSWAQEEPPSPVTPDSESTAAVIPGPVNQPPPTPQTAPPSSPYSRAYEVRQDIHKYASYATLPLFATEFALGESLGSEPGSDSSARGLHAAVGAGLVGLFFVNTVTGGWNLWHSRHEKERRTTRMIHGFLMIAANAGSSQLLPRPQASTIGTPSNATGILIATSRLRPSVSEPPDTCCLYLHGFTKRISRSGTLVNPSWSGDANLAPAPPFRTLLSTERLWQPSCTIGAACKTM
jgi:hypothetical protein